MSQYMDPYKPTRIQWKVIQGFFFPGSLDFKAVKYFWYVKPRNQRGIPKGVGLKCWQFVSSIHWNDFEHVSDFLMLL